MSVFFCFFLSGRMRRLLLGTVLNWSVLKFGNVPQDHCFYDRLQKRKTYGER